MAKILVVDDEPKVRTILKIILSAKQHEIREAGNGKEALSILETEPIDMVITDIRMDGLLTIFQRTPEGYLSRWSFLRKNALSKRYSQSCYI